MTHFPGQTPIPGKRAGGQPQAGLSERFAPRNHACPAGHDRGLAGDFQRAWQALMNNNPLPATHGRICHHPCEDACNRVQIADVVSIHAIERFLGDMAISQNWPMRTTQADTGKKMLVVGASIRSDDGLPSATPRA